MAADIDPDLVVTEMTMRNGHGATLMRRLRGMEPAVRSTPEVAPPVPEIETDALERAAEMYASALPHRLASIATSAQEGDALAVATAAEILAEASDRTGHSEIAVVSHAIAENARRGIVAHARLMQLVRVCARVEGNGQALVGQATSR